MPLLPQLCCDERVFGCTLAGSRSSTKRIQVRRASPPPVCRSAHSTPSYKTERSASNLRPLGGIGSLPFSDAPEQQCESMLEFFRAVLERKQLCMSPELSGHTRKILLRLFTATASPPLTEQGAMAYAEYMGIIADCWDPRPSAKASPEEARPRRSSASEIEKTACYEEWLYTVANRQKALRSTSFASRSFGGISADFVLMALASPNTCNYTSVML